MRNHEEQTKYVTVEGKGFVEEPNQNNLFPKDSVTDENPETLSMMLKNITSKNEARVQLLKSQSIGVKPRTRLRSKLQVEMELVHEDCEEIVMINDSFSEEVVHTSKVQYGLDNENFINVQGVAGSIPEIFCTNKQVCSEDCSVSKLPHEDEVLMK